MFPFLFSGMSRKPHLYPFKWILITFAECLMNSQILSDVTAEWMRSRMRDRKFVNALTSLNIWQGTWSRTHFATPADFPSILLKHHFGNVWAETGENKTYTNLCKGLKLRSDSALKGHPSSELFKLRKILLLWLWIIFIVICLDRWRRLLGKSWFWNFCLIRELRNPEFETMGDFFLM